MTLALRLESPFPFQGRVFVVAAGKKGRLRKRVAVVYALNEVEARAKFFGRNTGWYITMCKEVKKPAYFLIHDDEWFDWDE